ncbi:MAG TPA: hypothetical protein GXX14_06770 [Clostridiaceae bacterium]|nr:hypothetical protein [Clostridiaceae bacterium]
MNEQDLEKLLKKGKKETENFFSHVCLNSIRNTVHNKISEQSSGQKAQKEKPIIKHCLRFLPVNAAITAMSLLIIISLLIGTGIVRLKQEHGTKAINTPVAEQTISLNDDNSSENGNRSYLVSFFPINKPNHEEQSLMIIMWKIGSDGNSEMVYSSLFEKSDEPYPVSTIEFSDANSKLILISSGNRERRYMHYRLIEYSNDTISTLWSQDFVPDGKLGVKDGIVVEQRSLNGTYSDSSMSDNPNANTRISYIVPYKTGSMGEVFLPVEKLNVRVGEQILLVGDNSENSLRIFSEKGIIKEVGYESNAYGKEQGLVFQAANKGDDVLSLVNSDNGNIKVLAVSIVD